MCPDICIEKSAESTIIGLSNIKEAKEFDTVRHSIQK